MSTDYIFYAIYRSSLEFPHSYVVRRWEIRDLRLIDDNLPLCVAPTLEDARMVVPTGKIRFGREPEDDPAVEESWL
jgi:hypothetical protein